MTEAVVGDQSSFTSDLGIIVKPRPRRPKSYFVRFVEFSSVCQWVTGFLFFGISCYAVFMYLIYSMLKHLVLFVWFSVSEPHEDWFVYSITSWDKMEALYTSVLAALVGLYLYYWQHDLRAEERGSHPRTWLRNLWLWKRMADYFPIQLVLSDELLKSEHAEAAVDCKSGNQLGGFGGLSTKRNYMVGYHPHGVFSTGAFVNFMTEATGFSLAFPGLTPWLAVLKAHFKSPFYRDYLMALGIIAATKRGLRYLLDAEECGKTGNFVVVVVGGAPEALEAKPGQYRLVIRQRYGFFKLAIQTGQRARCCSKGTCCAQPHQEWYSNALFPAPSGWANTLQPSRWSNNDLAAKYVSHYQQTQLRWSLPSSWMGTPRRATSMVRDIVRHGPVAPSMALVHQSYCLQCIAPFPAPDPHLTAY
ncbi:hypothetical protein T265_08312 [Opisthorchis viverrini]|uniref:Acyltransferase n=1 Tax=Opisthorchis viverrini TaxID=6198 RepID=A0A074Z9U8_OPIVI|nr:hypothetical protein T265_08312 [Opisthorchis viverrini]KER23893.1 hypothetical protein T265_08312 [Opisthorchis viverrini]